jgi:hypothetical protein
MILAAGHTSCADFWNHFDAFLIWRTWLHHDPVSPLKNTPELPGITVEINNLRGNRLPSLNHETGPWAYSRHLAAVFQYPKLSKNQAPDALLTWQLYHQ